MKRTLPVIIGVGVFVAGGVLLWASTLRLPDLDVFEERIVQQSTKIYDRTGDILLFDLHENIQRTVVPFDAISRHAKNATVAIEDAEFYEHSGIRPLATFRAVFIQPLRGLGVQGGSTITQQVVKNALLTQEKKISRKLKEWILAFKLDQTLPKEEILATYLNESPYGGSIYGIQEASRAFFGKEASDISLAEAAYLAALPRAPTYYSPYGNNRDELESRKNLVLSKMLENGFITESEFDDAKEEDVTFLPRSDRGIKAPHFVMYVREQLEQRYGEQVLEEGGLKVITSLDFELQQTAQEIVRRHALENEERFNAENASLVAVDPHTGHILVMVGSRDYFDEEIDGNFNITLTHRQPGSAFKPFVYASALKKGYTPETVVFDLSTEFSTTCGPDSAPLSADASCYRPVNYDGKFRGPVTFREALAQSINIPAVKVLYLAGLDESLRTARDLGIQSLTNKDQYGLTLVLGGGEVAPLDMASAYGVFANEGVRNEPVSIIRVEDERGTIIDEYTPRSKQVLDQNIAAQISDILSDNDARAPAFGQQSYLHFPNRDVAVKTGTTNDFRDAWIVGYSPNISAAAWAGNNDNSPMEKRVAGFIVAPLWNEFMTEALKKYPDDQFPEPQKTATPDLKPILRGIWRGGVTYLVDTVSGKLATDLTPPETTEERVVEGVHSILYWVDKDDPTGPPPKNPSRDPQFIRWEKPVRLWAQTQGYEDESLDVIPDEEDDIHTKKDAPRVSISGFDEDEIYDVDDILTFTVSTEGGEDIDFVEVYINNAYIGKASREPFSFRIDLDDIESVRDSNTLRVVAVDEVFNRGSQEIVFEVNVSQ